MLTGDDLQRAAHRHPNLAREAIDRSIRLRTRVTALASFGVRQPVVAMEITVRYLEPQWLVALFDGRVVRAVAASFRGPYRHLFLSNDGALIGAEDGTVITRTGRTIDPPQGLPTGRAIAFSPDDRTMYFADTPLHTIWAFDFDIDAGAISNQCVFAELTARKGLPDGSCVDAEGFLWNAEFAGKRLTRYAPDGRFESTVELPVTSPTCCCFGGDTLDTLYVVSSTHRHSAEQRKAEPCSGGLLALNAGERGLPEAMFGG